MGWPKPPQALGGGPATPKSPKPIFHHFLAFWGGRTIPIGMGWFDHPRPAKNGVVEPPLGQKWGGRATPFWPSHPRFSPSFFFLFLMDFHLLKKIKNNAQNDVILD
jgi:hypothetical protein